MTPLPFERQEILDWLRELQSELVANILPFWLTHTLDEEHGGLYGSLTNDLEIDNDVPRPAILYGRVLWTFAAAYRVFREDSFLAMARRTYDYLERYFWDEVFGGAFSTLDRDGHPQERHKHTYAQAFVLYGLTEYHLATNEPQSLERASELFALLERHAHDDTHGGYHEGRSESWSELADPSFAKSMNTTLHLLEAYTNLARCHDDPLVRTRLRELVMLFCTHVVDTSQQRSRLFFARDFTPLPDYHSPGHDLEASWLLTAATALLGDPDLDARATAAALALAQGAYSKGRDTDGAIIYERREDATNYERHWWPQAEGVIGFYNAYQHSGRREFAAAARALWRYIDDKLVDRVHGEWFKVLNRDGTPCNQRYKTGPWECPYHQSRMCLEMLARLRRL